MASFKLTLNTGIRANVLSVLRGTQSGAGITLTRAGLTGASAIDPLISGDWNQVTYQNDPASTGTIKVGGNDMKNDGTEGLAILVGDAISFSGDRVRHSTGNDNIVATVNAAVINIELTG